MIKTILSIIIFFIFFPIPTLSQNTSTTTKCPLNFTTLNHLSPTNPQSQITDCKFILKTLRLVLSDHLRHSNTFLPPPSAAEPCWSSLQSYLRSKTDVRTTCGFKTEWLSLGCMNISTRSGFDSLVPAAARRDISDRCGGDLSDPSLCASCITALVNLPALYLTGTSPANVSDCTAYPSIYAAAFSNPRGPADPGTAKCLFNLDFGLGSEGSNNSKKNVVAAALLSSFAFAVFLALFGFVYWRRRAKRAALFAAAKERERGLGSALESITGSNNLVKFSFVEVKKATGNFSRENIIGRGGYGNVYRGVLPDGDEVALKRFKNCSAAGDAGFAHEVEVIASVRHVNLVALRGYCIATTEYEGHQRIIVCDLVKNGSLHDHLFGENRSRNGLSWPARRKIALGTARGLAYLHYGTQPAIIHRDIKANNILIDENFDAKVADFGLAKFTPEGMASHVSTRVAGTMGYVAPEYAIYGQLSERSDVYSFGVVLLELLSGKKALIVDGDGGYGDGDGEKKQPLMLADWAWGLVREGRVLDVVEDNVAEKGSPEVMEKYVLVAVLCSHPQVMARPTMDQVVKMLETDLSVPSIPDRPLPIVADIGDIERSMSSVSSVSAGYLPY